MTRRQILFGAAAVPLTAQGGWQLRFVATNDFVEIRVSGARGQLIQFASRGCGNYTWCRSDPAGEVQSIARWFGDSAVIGLYARATGGRGYGSCRVEVLFGSGRIDSWEFTGESYREFRR